MRQEILDNADAIGEALAEHIVSRLLAASNERFVLCCPSGRSFGPLYRALGRRVGDAGLDLSKLVIVMLDEYLTKDAGGFRWIDPTFHCSCRHYANETIVGALNKGLPSERQVAPDRIWLPDPSEPAGAFDARLAAAGGIDLFLLASGTSDGHVGFNPPGSPADSVTRIIELADQTRLDNMTTYPQFTSLDQVPRFGITVGIATIRNLAKSAAMVLSGKAKQAAFRHVSQASGYDPDWPATVVTSCRDAVLYADELAASA